MASATAASGRSGFGSFEIDEEEDLQYQVLTDIEESLGGNIHSSSNGDDIPHDDKRKAMSGRVWNWLWNPFARNKPPGLQQDLRSIVVVEPPNAPGPQLRDGSRIQRRMTPVMRNIKSCIGWIVTRCSRVLSLTDAMAAEWIAFMSNAAVVGILTLNIFSATYFLAWRKENSSCNFPFPPEIFHEADTVTRLMVISLPFICFLLASVIGALGNAAQKEVRFLGCAAGLALCEIIYIIFLGSVMMTCISNMSGIYTGIAAMMLLGLVVFVWGCCCHQPKALRYLVLSKCCCPDADDIA